MQMVFELVDEGVSSNTPATVLYDTAATGAAVTGTPGTCVFAAVDSANLVGSVASVEVTRPGSLWVVSTLPNGTVATRLIGAAGQGVDCEVDYGSQVGTPGKVTFFAGRVPVAGERVTVSYRNQGRAVARIADAVSVAAEAAAGAGVSVAGGEPVAGEGAGTGGAVECGLRGGGDGGAGDGDGAVGGTGGQLRGSEPGGGCLAGRSAGGDECGCDYAVDGAVGSDGG